MHKYVVLDIQKIEGEILLIQLNHAKPQNPFSRKMNQELIDLASEIPNINSLKAVVITGGKDRSFSVGGDFNEVSQLREDEEVAALVEEIFDLYIALLNIKLPLIAAIDHYAIGQGLQVALMTDWKIASKRSVISMPELKNGVACPLGSMVLQHLLGCAKMLELVIDCPELNAQQAQNYCLVNEIVSHENLIEIALNKAKQLGNYPAVPFRETKQINNHRFIDILENVRHSTVQAHVASFKNKSGSEHFQKILAK